MATSIERLKPKQLKRRTGTRALSVFDRPGSVAPHLDLAKRMWAMEQEARSPEISLSLRTAFHHQSSEVGRASRRRSHWLPMFQAADAALGALLRTHGSLSACVPRPVRPAQAIDMLTALFGAFGAKDDRDLLLATVDMLESGGELAAASETAMQRPLYVSAVSLALACRTLITTTKFRPQPAELATACRDADRKLWTAQSQCEDVVNCVCRCDAILLEFAPEQWCEPYLTSHYRPMVQRMLDLHAIYGNGDDEFYAYEPDDWEEKPHNQNFRLALMRARSNSPSQRS